MTINASTIIGIAVFIFIAEGCFVYFSKKQTQKNTLKLRDLLGKSHESAKLLVRKDRELTLANLELLKQKTSLEETAKILVGRDLELSQINQRLQEIDTVKSEFVSMAAHQLRTPLTGVKWSIQTLLVEGKNTFDSEQKNLIKEALGAIDNLAELINSLLDLARLEEGRSAIDIKQGNLISVIKGALERLRVKTSKKAVMVELKITETTFPPIPFDKQSINMVLDILLDNAFKFSFPGNKIIVSVELVDEKAIVNIQDTGIGIPENEKYRVFTRFFRGKNTKDMRVGGTGIGLSLAKNIIEQHNGRIWFESQENEGSKFSFSLPI